MRLLTSIRDALFLIGGMVLVLAAISLIMSLPDVARYLRIRSM